MSEIVGVMVKMRVRIGNVYQIGGDCYLSGGGEREAMLGCFLLMNGISIDQKKKKNSNVLCEMLKLIYFSKIFRVSDWCMRL